MSIIFAGDFLPQRLLHPPPCFEGASIVANLECAISEKQAEASKAYTLVLGKEALDVAAHSGFAALSLANNHVCDAGTVAFNEMVRALTGRSDTQFYGTQEQPFATLADGPLRCAVIGCLGRSRSRRGCMFRAEHVESLLGDLIKDFDRVFVTPHWGKEGECASHPSPQQRALARRWIKAGAHAILGHHSHSFHGRERMNGHPVYYSLGNLVFDHEEGKRFPLTHFGLAVTWTVGERPSSDRFKETIVFQKDGVLQPLDTKGEELLSTYLDAISNDFTHNGWGYLKWARAVGPVYIPKARAAWAKRVAGPQCFRARVLRLVWSLLPKTILLAWGNRFPLQEILARTKRLESIVRSKYLDPH